MSNKNDNDETEEILQKSEYRKKLIEKYYQKSQTKIKQVLTEKYKYTGEKLNDFMEAVNKATISSLQKKYVYSETLQEISELWFEYEFQSWAIIVNNIPFYHSLGDTLGYYNGNWEFNYMDPNVGPEYANEMIYEFISLGGINDISIVNWQSSDDTILYMATYHVLTEEIKTIDEFGNKIRNAYINALPMIENRGIGETTKRSLEIQKNIKWNQLPYNNMDIGAGAAMRSGCIGIFFPGKHNRKKLIALAVESSRITHNSAIAILGSVVAALFTAYAIERTPIEHWPHKLFKLLKSNKIDDYMEKSRPNEYHLYARDKVIYIGQWEKYISIRFSGLKPRLDNKILKNPVKRIAYLSANFSKGHQNNPGSCGDDAVIMAYDALLESGDILEKLIVYAILHPGDSDTVGAIAMGWFGAFYHSQKNGNIVYQKFDELEFVQQIQDENINAIEKIIRVYFYDIYLDTARKVMKRLEDNN